MYKPVSCFLHLVSSALYLAVCEAAGEKPMTHRR